MLLSPAAERNQEDIVSVLADMLEEQSHKELFGLELGSGTGQHVVRFAQELPYVTWLPSDIKEESRTSIRAYITATKVTRVMEPVHLDASEPWEKWAGLSRSSCDVIVAINLFHVSSFKTAEGVFEGAGELLRKNGIVLTYGPYAVNGIIVPPSNEELDRTLRERNPEWGLPDVDILRQLAFTNGMRMERMIEMPESNKCLIFRKI